MNIAIDLDGTIDRDLAAWQEVVETLIDHGHEIYIVTSRGVEYKKIARRYADCIGISRNCVVCTSGAAKRWFCEQRGLKIDVWIDDDPACIENGK